MTQKLSIISEFTTAVHRKFSTVILKTPYTNQHCRTISIQPRQCGQSLSNHLGCVGKNSTYCTHLPTTGLVYHFDIKKTSYCELSKKVLGLYFVANIYKMCHHCQLCEVTAFPHYEDMAPQQ